MTKAVKIVEAPDAAGEAPPPALLELLSMRDEIGSIKQRAFHELRKWSRSLVGIMLLSDDLAECASLDEAMVRVRQDHDRLSVERDALKASIASLKGTEEAQRARTVELAAQVEVLVARVDELERRERTLIPTVQRYENLAAAIEASERTLAELRAEESRLRPILAESRRIEMALPERQRQLDDIERRLASIRASI